MIGICVEQSSCGDKDDLKDQNEFLYEASKFRRLNQYESVLLQRKKPLYQKILAFSFLRTVVNLNMYPRGLRDGIREEEEDQRVQPDRRIAKYLKVFNGLKGSAVFINCWGITFWFSWYSVISNPEGVDDMTSSLYFNIVSSTVYTAPLFFFCSGFL
jgi:hypothetical protein